MFEKYLGLPVKVGRSKMITFANILERVYTVINSWDEKFLSAAGKEVMVKAVIQAIPNYAMSCFLFPTELCDQIESLIRSFWWNRKKDGKGICWVAWEKIKKPKTEGGLGFRDFRSLNLALLAKQGWRIMTKPESLLARILKAKYFRNSDFLEAELGHDPSQAWRGILEGRRVIEKGVYIRIGNGRHTRIFHDRWIPRLSSFKVCTPNPFAVSPFVSDLFNNHTRSWDEGKIASIFNAPNCDEIKKLVIPYNEQPDQWAWFFDKLGVYTVKSGYHVAESLRVGINQDSASRKSSTQTDYWNNLWHTKAHRRAILTTWRAIHGSLGTSSNLNRRGIQVDPLCSWCGDHTETEEHLFMQCKYAKLIWNELLGSDSYHKKHRWVKPWIVDSISNLSSENRSLFVVTIWVLWKAWNLRVFERKVTSVSSISQRIRFLHLESLKDPCGGTPEQCPQPDPGPQGNRFTSNRIPEGWFMIYTDGACVKDTKAAIGNFIYDHAGFLIAAMAAPIPQNVDPKIPEALAVKEGLFLASRLGLCHIQMRVDLQSIPLYLDHKGSDAEDRSMFGSIMKDCRKISERFASFSCEWIPRKLNTIAHQYAQVGLDLNNARVWMGTGSFSNTSCNLQLHNAVD